MMTTSEITRAAPAADAKLPRTARGGFSLVELVVAIVILAIGVVGLAGTTAYIIRQVTLADVNTERSAAVQSAVERIRSSDFDSVDTGGITAGSFSVTWSVVASTGQTKTVRVVSAGPGLVSGASVPTLSGNVQDTFSFMVLNP